MKTLDEVMRELLRELETRPRWRTTGQVALFYHTECEHCGSIFESFEGLYEEREDRNGTHLVRYHRIPEKSNLPRERRYYWAKAPYCPDCVDLPSYREPPDEPIDEDPLGESIEEEVTNEENPDAQT